VMDHVLTTKQGVLVSDAAEDERFRGGESIVRHAIREVLCVPMRGRHDTVGVLFLDTRAAVKAGSAPAGQPVKFTEDHLRLAIAVAHQAALAIEENNYHQALLQAERLAAIGQTIAALSHHIKNIMQGVRFGSDMVRMALPELDRDLLTKGWRLVEKNQTKIDDLILDMLSFSKEREPLKEPTDLNGLVAEVLEVVRGRADDAGIELCFRPCEGLPAVACDCDGIHHAVLNIVSNAIDAVEGKPSPRVGIEIRKVEDRIEIAVEDNGPGIPAVKLAEIFKPFVSTKGARGTGLGLPVSRKTLREHGGDVLATSAVGSGTRFVLQLPASP
jgi:two-component system NtrC family sensor kinase